MRELDDLTRAGVLRLDAGDE
jgi:hypothetical protein